MKGILKLNFWRILTAILTIAILSAFQYIEEVKTVMIIISVYLFLVFIFASFKAIKRLWFTK